MKKIILLINVILITLIGVILTTEIFASNIIIKPVDLTAEFVDPAIPGDFHATKNSSSGWTYVTPSGDPYSWWIKTKRVRIDVNRITEVRIPRLLLIDDKIRAAIDNGLGMYDSRYREAIAIVDLKFFNTNLSNTPYKTVGLKNTDSFGTTEYAFLDAPIELDGPTYIEIHLKISQIAENIMYRNVPFGIDWNQTYDYKQAIDTLFFNYRASFRTDLMNFTIEQYGLTYVDEKNNSTKNYNDYKAVFYGEEIIEAEVPSQFDSLNNLTTTTGSFFRDAKPSDMGKVSFIREGNNVVVLVQNKGQSFYLNYNFSSETDVTMFDANEAYYFTDDFDDKYIIINLGENNLFNPNGTKRAAFEPYVIWHLESNEFYKFDRFNVYMYALFEGPQLFGYFYVDDFVIDELLSVSLSYRFRYIYSLQFWRPYGDWQTVDIVLEKDKSQLGSTFSFWEQFLYYPAMAQSILGIVPLSQLPNLLVGTYLWYNRTSGGSEGNIFVRNIQDIEKILSPSQALINMLNQKYAEAYDDDYFNGISQGLSIFKLYLGEFNDPFATGKEIDSEYSLFNHQKGINIVQLTYMTQGQIYEVSGEDIRLDPILPEPDKPWIELPQISFNIEFISAVAIFIAVMVVGVLNFKGGISRIKIGDIIRIAIIGLILAALTYLAISLIMNNTINISTKISRLLL